MMTRRILIDMKDLGNLIESVADAFAESFASRTRRNAGAGRLIAPPPPGTPLLVSLALALEHTGVYLGDNKVAELQDDGVVKTVSLTDFINGDTAPFPLRNGTRIFAACDARSRKPLGTAAVAKMARRLSDEAYYAGYDLIQSNCHLFVAACAAGLKPNDTAFAKLVGKGFASIGRLERVLALKLNGGRRIEWCPVARNKERFHYKLTEEKVARLRLEGKI